jgi:beta-1,4-N-acetylglucosaminyltransferase
MPNIEGGLLCNVFTTVGTYREGYDSLIEEIDQICLQLPDFRFVSQVGYGKYKVINHQALEFTDDIECHFQWADIVVCSGGAGTIFPLLKNNKKIVSIVDRGRIGVISEKRGYEFTNYFAQQKMLIACRNISNLKDALLEASLMDDYNYKETECTISSEIISYIEGSS